MESICIPSNSTANGCEQDWIPITVHFEAIGEHSGVPKYNEVIDGDPCSPVRER